mgnify:CR=1 FL=1
MIETQQLGYRYSKKTEIFNDLTLRFQPGTIYGLLGKNGAGKSTLIKNLTGMLFPTKGHCSVFGHQPKHRSVAFLKELFFVPEDYYLPNLSINTNIFLSYTYRKQETIIQLFKIVHIDLM